MSEIMKDAVYRFSSEKAFAAIHWMVSQGQPVDLHAALKACYFADKSHINQHYQPIFGARYMAMKYGPVPVEIYEMMKGEGLWLWEVGVDETPWRLDGYRLSVRKNMSPDMACFSSSEREHLEAGFGKSQEMTFSARTAATHQRDWQAANGGRIRYEDMIEDSQKRDAIVDYIRQNASHAYL